MSISFCDFFPTDHSRESAYTSFNTVPSLDNATATQVALIGIEVCCAYPVTKHKGLSQPIRRPLWPTCLMTSTKRTSAGASRRYHTEVKDSTKTEYIQYILLPFFLLTWYFHNRWLRRIKIPKSWDKLCTHESPVASWSRLSPMKLCSFWQTVILICCLFT